MNRLLITGKNKELERDVFSRTASQAYLPPGSSHSQATREAVSHSGAVPDSAPGGTRQSTPARRASSRMQPTLLSRLGARFWWDCIVMFIAGLLTVAALTLVLL